MAAKTETASEKAVDDAFQALLSSQRNILTQMNFGNSTSELQFTEGPDNLPIVSPHASAEFDNSYSEYEGQEGEYHYQESLRASPHSRQHSVGVGNDRFILDQISIGPGVDFFDVDTERRMMRKRETELELMEVVAQRKKRKRRGSITFTSNPEPTFSDDLLPSPCDLDLDLDDSAASLLLDDLDFPSIDAHTDAAMCGPQETEEVAEKGEMKTLSTEDEMEKKPMANDEPVADTSVAMEEEMEVTPPSTSRSQMNLWKPRKRDSTPSSDSCVSLDVEDLEAPVRCVSRNPSSQSQQRDREVMDSDLPPVMSSRADSSDSASGPTTVKALSVALQQSIGTMQNIQNWDKKMGLKRSHSKTMRLSSKSREQLLALFSKKEEDSEESPSPSTVPGDDMQGKKTEKVNDEPAMIEA